MALKRWLGTAGAIQQIGTITIGGTPANADTHTVTIGGSAQTVTFPSAPSTTEAATAIANAINASGREDNITTSPGDETRNSGGQELPEFREISATSSGAVVTYVVDDPGWPVTLTVAKTGSLTTVAAVTQVATGPHYIDNVENWSGGALPASNDELWFSDNDVDVLFGSLTIGNLVAEWHVLASYTGKMGLPDINRRDGEYPYQEYRERRVVLPRGTNGDSKVFVGGGDGRGTTRARFSWTGSTGDLTIVVYKTGNVPEGQLAVDFLIGSSSTANLNTANVSDGSVGFSVDAEGSSGHLDAITIGTPAGGNPTVRLGNAVAILGETLHYSGRCYCHSGSSGGLKVFGGEFWLYNTQTGAIKCEGGRLNVIDTKGIAPSELSASGGGVIDCSKLQAAFTEPAVLRAGSGFLDPNLLLGGVVDLDECGLEDLSILRIGKNKILTITSS